MKRNTYYQRYYVRQSYSLVAIRKLWFPNRMEETMEVQP